MKTNSTQLTKTIAICLSGPDKMFKQFYTAKILQAS